MKIDLSRMALFIIYKDDIQFIKKKKGFNYHIEYYLALAKKDPKIKEILSMFSIPDLLEHPSEVHPTINLEIGKSGYVLLLNMVPQIPTPSSIFVACMPESINDYQKEVLSSLVEEPYEFLDFGVYQKELSNYKSFMKEEDYGKENFYLIKKYLETQENHKKI